MIDDNEYCEKHCKGYYDTGGRCFADGRCDAYLEYQKQKGVMERELRNDRMAVERWKQACKAGCIQRNYRRERGLTETRDDFFVDGVQWADEHPAETLWRSTDEWPKDKEPILMKLDNGKYQYSEWEADGKGFNEGFAEINFGGGAMMRLPIEYRVVAWRPLADVINELNDHGIIKKED
jgi:hypothetical protein